MLKNFAIIGERCSGTNFLTSAVARNFELPQTVRYGHKHWFKEMKFENSDETLFIGIVREFHQWACSLYHNPHHLLEKNTRNIRTFISSPTYVVPYGEGEGKPIGFFLPSENYMSIFHLRNDKNRFLLEEMPRKVKHFILIRYEDLRDDYEGTLNKIAQHFEVRKKEGFPIPVKGYKGSHKRRFSKRTYKDINKDFLYNEFSLDKELERRLGYLDNEYRYL